MTRIPITFSLAAAVLSATAPSAKAQTHISVSVVKPGVYGRIDIGDAPPPVVLVQPVIIAPQPAAVAPAYLYVPPGHRKKWSKHCHRYAACGVPVYFVQERWVQERYEHEHGKGPGKGHGRGHGKGKHGD